MRVKGVTTEGGLKEIFGAKDVSVVPLEPPVDTGRRE